MGAAPTKPEAASADRHRAEPPADIVLGVIVAPGLARDVTAKIASELAHDLEALDLGVEWRTDLTVDRLVSPPARTTEIIDAARRKLLDEDWDLCVVVTDLPLRVGRRPVSRQVSPTHGIAVASLPALGALHLAPAADTPRARRRAGRRRRRRVERRRCARAPETPLGARRAPGARHRHRRSARSAAIPLCPGGSREPPSPRARNGAGKPPLAPGGSALPRPARGRRGRRLRPRHLRYLADLGDGGLDAYAAACTPKELDELSVREREVFRLMAGGLSNGEIGKELFISETTVKTHVTHILQKLSLRDRVQAVALAYQTGVFEPEMEHSTRLVGSQTD